ncbi:MAG: transglutaminase family protein [Kineosporiaceae bacterium]
MRHRYEVRHVTEYTYSDDVTSSYGRAFLVPRDTGEQWCRSTRLEVSPEPGHVSEHVDHYGNRTAFVEVHRPHRRLAVTCTSLVDVDRPRPDLAVLDAWTWEEAAAALPGPAAAGSTDVDPVAVRELLMPSPQIELADDVRTWAATVFTPGRPLGQALAALVHRIFTEFRYASGATSVTTTLLEVLAKREGVCQDFAHLAVGCLRSVGLPARYVSGYLETEPPPGKPKLQGADASHAWASVLVPDGRWLDLDPTNDQPADSRYVVTAWGRDYTDVPPLKGVIYTEGATSALKVSVDVIRMA